MEEKERYPWRVRLRLWWSEPLVWLIYHPRSPVWPKWFRMWVLHQRRVPPSRADMEWAGRIAATLPPLPPP